MCIILIELYFELLLIPYFLGFKKKFIMLTFTNIALNASIIILHEINRFYFSLFRVTLKIATMK